MSIAYSGASEVPTATHPAADLFPLLPEAELAELAEDIRANGLLEPIWVVDDPELGRVLLDGRNRLRACERVGVVPPIRVYEGDDPVAFVISLNLKRRHLSESQRAMVAARIANLPRGANQHRSIDLPSQDRAAELLNVSTPSVKRARVVLDHGTEGLADAVDSGQVPVSTAADIARATEQQQRDILASADPREITKAAAEIKRQRRDVRLAEKARRVAAIAGRTPAPLVSIGPFPVLYADPPWRYEHADVTRAIENHYPTMTLDEIKKLKVPAAEDSVLFMWVTSPKLSEGLEVMEAWGFDYRTCMVWVKDKIGMGYYARQQHELLLIGRRGSLPVPDPEDRPSSVLRAERSEHSAKPDLMYELIERMYPLIERCEMFQRRPRDGWAGWGNQA